MKERTPESLALEAAFDDSGLSQAAVATHMGVTPGAARQWIKGHRPVPATKAVRLAALVGARPEAISAAYAETMRSGGATEPADDESGAPTLQQLERQIDALRYALAGMITVNAVHRPVEAKAVAAALRRAAPKKYQEHGLIRELLVTLDAAAMVKLPRAAGQT